VSLRIPSSSRSPDHDPHRTIYYLGYPLGRFAGLKHRHKPLKGCFGSLQAFSIGRMPGDRNLLSLDATCLAQAHFGPVRSPLRSRGSSRDYALCLFTCMILTMSSLRPRWRFFAHEVRSFMLQYPGVFLCSTLVLTTIGSDFIKLMNKNKTP
jgi:hypothetical protein